MKILLVDDDKSLLTYVGAILRTLGHTAEATSDPAKAVDLLEHGGFDVAFVDYSMPGHNGDWVLATAKVSKETKVILMTGVPDTGVINRMFKVGVRGYMIKPFDADELKLQLNFHSAHQVTAHTMDV